MGPGKTVALARLQTKFGGGCRKQKAGVAVLPEKACANKSPSLSALYACFRPAANRLLHLSSPVSADPGLRIRIGRLTRSLKLRLKRRSWTRSNVCRGVCPLVSPPVSADAQFTFPCPVNTTSWRPSPLQSDVMRRQGPAARTQKAQGRIYVGRRSSFTVPAPSHLLRPVSPR